MDIFEPQKYSQAENKFLLENVGKPPVVAFNQAMPEGVNPRAVRPVLQEVYDREQLREHDGIGWAGLEAVKDCLQTFITLDAKWESDFQRSRGRIPRFPSLYTRDGKGKYHHGGAGSDSDYPRTYEKDGRRVPLSLQLDGDSDDWERLIGMKEAPKELLHDEDKHRWECPICSHTESYKEGSASSKNAARARMSTHLKKATDEVDLHRELHTNEFGA